MQTLEQKVQEFVKKNGLEHKPEVIILDLVSEVGELAKEMLKASDYGKSKPECRESLKDELGDVLYVLIKFANYYKIDLSEALEDVLKKYDSRSVKTGQPGSSTI